MTTIVLGSGIITYNKNYSLYSLSVTGSISVANGLLLGEEDELYVLSGGVANTTTVDSGAGISLSTGGIAYDTTLNSGAYGQIALSGTGVGVYINGGAMLSVGGTASNVVAYSGATLFVDGTVSQATIHAGAVENVEGELVNETGIVINTTLQGGVQNIFSLPALVGPAAIARDTIIDQEGTQALSGDAYNTTINAGGVQEIFSRIVVPGIYTPSNAVGDVVNGAGRVINYAGYTSATTINNGGIEFVHYGAQAKDTTIESGGYLVALNGASISGVYGNGSVISSGLIISTSSEIETKNLDGVTLLAPNEVEFVLAQGNTGNLMVLSGGIQYVYGGITNATTVFAGGEEILQSGTAFSTDLEGGTLENTGGTIVNPTIGSDAVLVDSSAIEGDISFAGTGGTLIIEPQYGTYPVGDSYPSEIPEIYGFSLGDVIDLPIGRSSVEFTISESQSSFSTVILSTENANTGEPVGITLTLTGISSDQISTTYSASYPEEGTITLNSIPNAAGVACFVEGTKITTLRGEIPVQQLRIGDIVKLNQGGIAPIKWIGQRSYNGRLIAGSKTVLPICIKAHALENGVPVRDLWVSPGHAISIDGGLVHASKLVNGVSVVQAERVDSVSYFHIELECHEVIFAENCPVETFMDEDFREQFQNAAEYRERYPGCAAPSRPCLPRIERGFALQAIRRRLEARAGIPSRTRPLGPMRGFVDIIGPDIIAGWIQDVFTPNEPVSLDVHANGQLIVRVLADLFRPDVRDVGAGAGFHGFELPLKQHTPVPIEIKRSEDQALVTTIWTLGGSLRGGRENQTNPIVARQG